MEIDEEKFCEYLALHGSDIKNWPQAMRELGLRARHHPHYAALIAKEERFEKLLLEDDLSPMPADLVTRLLSVSSSSRPVLMGAWGFSNPLSGINPIAWAATLVIGFAIGFGASAIPSPSADESFLQSYLDDEEATL